MDDREALVGMREVADYIGVPIATLYQWRHRGEGPRGYRMGRAVRFRTADVEAWLEARLEDDPHPRTAA